MADIPPCLRCFVINLLMLTIEMATRSEAETVQESLTIFLWFPDRRQRRVDEVRKTGKERDIIFNI